jgi:hypothetical protein
VGKAGSARRRVEDCANGVTIERFLVRGDGRIFFPLPPGLKDASTTK